MPARSMCSMMPGMSTSSPSQKMCIRDRQRGILHKRLVGCVEEEDGVLRVGIPHPFGQLLATVYRSCRVVGGEMCIRDSAEFACVIYDGETGGVVAARDPIGIRPLFYGYSASGGLAIASEARSLIGWVDEILPFPPGCYLQDGKFHRYRDPAAFDAPCPDQGDAMPVSYTHLDVYKRQSGKRTPPASGNRFPACGWSQRQAPAVPHGIRTSFPHTLPRRSNETRAKAPPA